MDLLRNANEMCESARQHHITLPADDIATYIRLYDMILRDGELKNPEVVKQTGTGNRGRRKQSIAFNLLRRLRQHANSVLLFIRDLSVPFTNNLGERAVRMPKVKQKISDCFRTLDGAENFAVIRSCLVTLRKQGNGMLEVLQRAFAGNPIQPASG